jgi:hypothetical protein
MAKATDVPPPKQKAIPLARVQIVRRVPGGTSPDHIRPDDLLYALHDLDHRRRALDPERLATELRGLAELLVAAGTAEAPLAADVIGMFAESVLHRAATRLEMMSLNPARVADQYQVQIRRKYRRRRRS